MAVKRNVFTKITGLVEGFNFEKGGTAEIKITASEIVDLLKAVASSKKQTPAIKDAVEKVDKVFGTAYDVVVFKAMIAKKAVGFVPEPKE